MIKLKTNKKFTKCFKIYFVKEDEEKAQWQVID